MVLQLIPRTESLIYSVLFSICCENKYSYYFFYMSENIGENVEKENFLSEDLTHKKFKLFST